MKKVLVVDDEEFPRMLLREALERKGLEVLEADDGDTAVEIIYSHPDTELLILDLKMPRMNGKDTFRAIRALNPGIKCFICSSAITQEDVEVFSAVGVKTFLEKPYLLEDLYRAINSLTDSPPEPDACSLKKFKAIEECENERRQVKREPLEKAIDVSVNILEFKGSRKLDLKAATCDISNMGLGIKIDYPLEPGNVLYFNNEIGGHTRGVVKWIVKHEHSYKTGIEWFHYL
ncbi:MAG TPA: hypothetical protein DCP92_22065 [Nitrospiraceae bacterium]|jgi:CheY-like chemotaxis protein|nr:hypothetical protein [Nitrospiraceae bacterium]